VTPERGPALSCDAVRPFLPGLAEGALHAAGGAEVHLASCAACSLELARYRRLLDALAGLREDVEEPDAAALERLLEGVPGPGLRGLAARAAGNDRVRRAALSAGGVAVGAAVVGLLWWRLARRSEPGPEPAAAAS